MRFAIRGKAAAFSNGARELSVTTDTLGRATITELTPLGKGSVEIHVSASYEGQTVTATIHQTNFTTVAEAAKAGRLGPTGTSTTAATVGSSHGLSGLAIAGIVGGAGGAAAAVALTRATPQDSQNAEPQDPVTLVSVFPTGTGIMGATQFTVLSGKWQRLFLGIH